MKLKVAYIEDGDTFIVKPNWVWQGKEGDVIRPTGYDTPEKGAKEYIEMTNKLAILILNKEVEINPVSFSYDRLVCDVYIDGKNIADFFPEYKS